MGKVMIVVKSEDRPTTHIAESVRDAVRILVLNGYDVFVVPDDEEWPDLG